MALKKSFKLVNMTSTRVFILQAENIYAKLRHENTGNADVPYYPAHIGGVFGQRDVLLGKNIVRETKVGF